MSKIDDYNFIIKPMVTISREEYEALKADKEPEKKKKPLRIFSYGRRSVIKKGE